MNAAPGKFEGQVSVVIPTWNRAPALCRAVNSVLDQTFAVAEVLVCDDGSTDNSREMVEAIGDPRVRWSEGPRGGRPAIPRNRGIRESRGEWIAFLDDDDVWLPHKLETQLALVERYDCKASCTNAFRVLPGGQPAGTFMEGGDVRLTFAELLESNRVVCSSALVHRSIMSLAEGFPEDPSMLAIEDYALWLRVATLTDFACVSCPSLNYWDDPVNSLRKDGVDVLTQTRRVCSDFIAWAVPRNIPKSFVRAARKKGVIAQFKSLIAR